VQAAKAAILLCLAVATGSGTWYLRVRVPENHWYETDQAGVACMHQRRFGEAERQFETAIEVAHAFGDHDLRLGRSVFHRALALVALGKISEAMPLIEQAHAIHTKARGPHHPRTIFIRDYYFSLSCGLDQPVEAAGIDR
jgi:hypothetical protein